MKTVTNNWRQIKTPFIPAQYSPVVKTLAPRRWIRTRQTRNNRPLCSYGPHNVSLPPDGLVKLGLKKKDSILVQLLRPVFPSIRNWTLIDKIFTTLLMIFIIRSLYFMPLLLIDPNNLPSNVHLAPPEKAMLAELFMAHDSIPLNYALLGISPLILSGFFIQLIINVPAFQFLPGPFQHIITKKRLGVLTNNDVESASFRVAFVAGTIMAIRYALILRPYSHGGWIFFITSVLGMLGALALTRYCCNIIQKHGFGEGTSFLLLALTLSGFGKRAYSISTAVSEGMVPAWKVGIILLLYVCIVCCCVLFNEVHLRLPLTDYSMKTIKTLSTDDITPVLSKKLQNEQPSSVSSAPFFPIPISQTAVTALFLSSSVLTFLKSHTENLSGILNLMKSNVASVLMFGMMAFFVSMLPISGSSAVNLEEYLAGLDVGIKGLLPGEQTIKQLHRNMFQTQLFGACCLFFIVTCCLSLDILCSMWINTPIGSLNLVLLVSVISSGFKTMEAHIQSLKIDNILQKEKTVISLFQKT